MLICLLALILLLGSPFVLFSQTPDSVVWNLELSELVVAGRSPRQSFVLPSQTRLLTSSEIFSEGYVSAPALLENTGIVSIQKSQGGGGSPVIRGFEASRILLVVDDIRLNNLIYRSGHLQNLLTVDPHSLESLEVISGSSSVLYGSDALGGVIHLRTRQPQFNVQHGDAFVRYASASHELKTGAQINYGWKRWASFTSLGATSFGDIRSGRSRNPFLPDNDGYIMRDQLVETSEGIDEVINNEKSYQQVGTGYQQIDVVQKIAFMPASTQLHTANFQYSVSSCINRYDRLTDLSKGKPKFSEWYYGPQKRWLGAYHFNLTELPFFDRLYLTAAYQHVEESRHNRKLNDAWRTNRAEKVDVLSFSVETYKQAGSHSWEGGLDGVLNFLRTSAFSNNVLTHEEKELDTRYPLGRNNMHNVDLFLQHRYIASDRWKFSEGVRIGYSRLYSEFREQPWFPFLAQPVTQHNFTYSLHADARWQPSPLFALTGVLQSGFRVPNIDDMGKVFDSGAGFVVVPNPNLKPEKTIGAELHADWNIGSRLRVSPALYATYLFDAIGLARTTLQGADSVLYEGEMSPVYANRNNRRALITGGSIRLDATLWRTLSLDASWTYTYGRILQSGVNVPLDHVAPAFGRIGLSYQQGRWSADVWALFNHKKALKDYNPDGEDNIRYATQLGATGKGLPAWYTLNARIGVRIMKAHLQVGVDNLLDICYRTFASGVNAPGRSISVSCMFPWL